ncbi:MAG: L-lactate dehydrogenase [Planctomycetes bacterium]|nr:L-lactate dehydrogenase [Planctomycetota bacterium]
MTDGIDRRPTKVSIIGAGMVGSSLAYTLMLKRLVGEIVLVDTNSDRAKGEAMDISHALPFVGPSSVIAGEYADCSGSDVVVVTAGAAQKAGESRLSLAQRNVEIYKDIVPHLSEIVPDAVIIVVSNPVDVLTYATLRLSGLPWQRVVGSGTILDTARLRYELSAHCRLDPRNVHAYILGEHGDSEVPAWSATTVAGVPFPRFCQMCGRDCSPAEMPALFERVKNAAYEIIRYKGATYYAIASGVTRMIEAIVRDQNTVVTASALLHGEYGLEDLCLSVPVVLGRPGIRMTIEMPISPEEQERLRESAKVIRQTLDDIGL